MLISNWAPFFKPDVRVAGQSFVAKGKVTCSQLSDTEVQSYVRASTSFKVVLKCTAIGSPILLAECTCPLSKKGQFCKHVWASLLVAEDKFPDFLELKKQIEKKAQVFSEVPKSDYKTKQADYRKEQYQKQKARVKDQKKSKKSQSMAVEYPAFIEQALNYFHQNGFELRDSICAETIGIAKKKLSRVFHPDKGGSHEEIQELNTHAEALTKYSQS